jgi:hypothetical protein
MLETAMIVRRGGVRVLAAVLGSTVVLVLWGMLFWGFLAGPLGVFHAIANAPAVTRALLDGNVATGTYFMPWPRNTPETFASFVAQHKSGPFYRLSFVREGVDPNSSLKLLIGCLHYFGVALIVVLLLQVCKAETFARRVTVVLLAGVLGSLFITIGDPIWFHMPWDYARGELIYEVVAWALVAVTASALVPESVVHRTPLG